jgi:hypothetical protein
MNTSLAQHLAPELLSALIDEELDPRETREVQAHLGSCLHCRQRLDGLRRVATGLRELERVELPTSLDHSIRRQLALDRVAGGLRQRLEARAGAPRRLTAHVGVGFAVVVSLAAIGWLFTDALERRNTGVVVPISQGMFADQPREVGGLVFEWQGDSWRETQAVGEPQRVVASESEEWREIFDAHPGLESLFEESPRILLRWREELVELVDTRPARRQ